MNLHFAESDYLYLLLVIPALIGLFVLAMRSKKRAIRRFGQLNVIASLMPDQSKQRPVVKLTLAMLALTALLLAVARPQVEVKEGDAAKEISRQGVELMVALDVSNSMRAKDQREKPDRLTRAKRAILRLINRLKDDKFGLIVFAGEAYMQVPMTLDYAAVRMVLDNVNTNIVSRQGTDIAAAIDMAIRSFGEKATESRVLIIITDGENHDSDVEAAAQRAREAGIVIHTVGMGNPNGSPIPATGGIGYQKDESGNRVISKLDETTLRKVANSTNGIYVRANDTYSELTYILEEINEMEKSEVSAKIYSDYDDIYQYFVAAALLFLLIDLLILDRKNRYLKDISIFE